MLINVKMPTIVGILTFMSWINFVLSWVEHGKSLLISGPGHTTDNGNLDIPLKRKILDIQLKTAVWISYLNRNMDIQLKITFLIPNLKTIWISGNFTYIVVYNSCPWTVLPFHKFIHPKVSLLKKMWFQEPGSIQASTSKIQGFFKDFLQSLKQFSRA